MLLCPALPATAAPVNYETARKALEAARDKDGYYARKLAKNSGDPVLVKLVAWIHLTQNWGSASFDEIEDFIYENPEWPYIKKLELRAEDNMPRGLPDAEVVVWFGDHPPQTVNGFLRYMDALIAQDMPEKAFPVLQKFWRDGGMSRGQLQKIRSNYGRLLTPDDYVARLDNLLWKQRFSEASDMLPMVPAGHRALAQARIALARDEGNVTALLSRVPENLQNDPSLIYERVKWRRVKNLDDRANELLFNLPPGTPQNDDWWKERNILARRAIEKQDYMLAYRLVSGHGMKEGLSFAQAEWMSGWLALRYLNKPKIAFDHFNRLYQNVSTPISLSRAAYWAGRASEAMNYSDIAKQWYETAAQFPTTYYGQIATANLKRPLSQLTQASLPTPSAEEKAAFESNELVQAVRYLHAADMDQYVTPFMHALSQKAKSHVDHAMVSAFAQKMGNFNTSVLLAKRSIGEGIMLINEGYPALPYARANDEVDPALVHALIRQESAFDTYAESSAGAVGLMQLLPSTAKHVAERNKIRFNQASLTRDPRYNVMIGTRYLKSLLDRYNGSYVLAIAAYNAGPGRVDGLLKIMGDPRQPGVDIIDWVENIPLYETRNYVQRVLEGYHVYKHVYEDPTRTIVVFNQR